MIKKVLILLFVGLLFINNLSLAQTTESVETSVVEQIVLPVLPKKIDSEINNAIVQIYGEQFAPKEKLWMQQRTTVMLPIKYSYKE
jgi:hypothetical protein